MPVARFEHIALAYAGVGKCWRSKRRLAADIADLAGSIAKFGPMSPIIGAPTQETGQYELVAGHRHLLAAKRLGHPTVFAGILDRSLGEAQLRAIAEVDSAPTRVSQADPLCLQRMTSGAGHKLLR